MSATVYLDMLFLMNFLMDSVIIYSASLILGKYISVGRLALAAGISALYSAVMFFPQLSPLFALPLRLGFTIFPSCLAFPTKKLSALIKNTVVLFGTYAVFGGITFAIIFATDFGTTVGAAISNGELYLSVSPAVLLASTITAYATVYVISYVKKRSESLKQLSRRVEISLFGKSIKIHAIADTGCLLVDPLTEFPAIVVSAAKIKDLLPASVSLHADGTLSFPVVSPFSENFRVLPYCTVDTPHKIMHGFMPDFVKSENFDTHCAVIAIAPHNLNTNGEYDAVFNPALLHDAHIAHHTPTSQNI